MNFQESLRSLVDRTKGARAAVLMGFDGIPVAEASVAENSLSFTDLSVEYSRLLSEAAKVAQANSLGSTDEFVLTTEQGQFVFRILKDGYFLGLLIAPGGILGKGRFLLRKLAPVIQNDL